jgi:membrane protease YdiL (CAAX protease family)
MGVGAVAALVVMRRQGLLSRTMLGTPGRSCDGLPWAAWALLASATFLLMAAAASLVHSGAPGGPVLRMSALTGLAATGAPLLALGALYLVRSDAATRAGLVVRPADGARGGGALLLTFPIVWTVGFVSVQAAALLTRMLGGSAPTEIAHETLRQLTSEPRTLWWWLTVASAGICAPIAEEILYRGFLQSALVRALGPSWAPVLITSAVFTVLHVGAADAHALPALFALSVALGAAFERTGRLGTPIVMHIGFNALNLAQALL